MAQDTSRTPAIRYDLLVQDALRGVVRGVLADTAKHGLPGEHHYYVTFKTRMPGVKLSNRMLAKYPETMNIVLQHVFWDLAVNDEFFEVGLSFGGQGEKLTVPFNAVTEFVDPSVGFGLKFDAREAPEAEDGAADASARQDSASKPAAPPRPALAKLEPKPAAAKFDKSGPAPAAPKGKEAAAPAEAGKANDSGAEKNDTKVVSIDAFRKKP
jgi:uncharacterized protein